MPKDATRDRQTKVRMNLTEAAQLGALCKHHKRTASDVVRLLISQEYERVRGGKR